MKFVVFVEFSRSVLIFESFYPLGFERLERVERGRFGSTKKCRPPSGDETRSIFFENIDPTKVIDRCAPDAGPFRTVALRHTGACRP